RPLPGTEAIRRAHFRLGHRAPGRGGRRARPVSGCVNSAFLNISQHFSTFYGPSVQAMDTRLGARHRRWTPMIHRGRARRTISAGAINPRGKETCVNRNFAATQGEATAEPCQGARQGLALPKIAYREGYVRRTYLGLIPWLVLARRPPSEVPSSRADHISSGLVRGSHRAASPHRLA